MTADIRFEEQCRCGYEAAELVMLACGGDFQRAGDIVKNQKAKATPELEDFYLNVFDGLSAVHEREKR
jgi:hypothetical protein